MAAPPSIIIDVEDDSDKENEAPVASGHTASFEANCSGTILFTYQISERKLSFRKSPDPIWTAGPRFTLW